MWFLLILGLVGLVVGIYRLQGPVNVVYMGFGVLVHIAYYVTIPSSIGLLIMGLAIFPIIPENWRLSFLLLGVLVALIGSLASSWLFKPAWLKWLELEHGDILPLLRIEIKKEGPSNWNNRIKTRSELEVWVLEVRQKYGK
jgi:hypothetical protein